MDKMKLFKNPIKLMYIILCILIITSGTFVELMMKQNSQLKQLVKGETSIINSHTNEIAELRKVENQNLQLSQENKTLSMQNQQYLNCNFLALAHYTQDFIPIQDSEINSCNLPPPKA